MGYEYWFYIIGPGNLGIERGYTSSNSGLGIHTASSYTAIAPCTVGVTAGRTPCQTYRRGAALYFDCGRLSCTCVKLPPPTLSDQLRTNANILQLFATRISELATPYLSRNFICTKEGLTSRSPSTSSDQLRTNFAAWFLQLNSLDAIKVLVMGLAPQFRPINYGPPPIFCDLFATICNMLSRKCNFVFWP